MWSRICALVCSPKNMVPAKIDLGLRGILEQRLYYPLYPPNAETPIEYSEIGQLYINEAPDILITPSDLIQFSKVTIVKYNRFL